ncbi:serine threonine-kinase [Micractinium conductrix]|uniref:Serine threonine-kinase n=1 Tax=Micractinium conductrix TaxID=554055 RepID=A0A2P6VKZ3_9CHLO|nr:serine threonine-kinase [Micractinium conductrix]|eukprot:PSC74771.1 serine threonine-kinase [Micractinium conductrix]
MELTSRLQQSRDADAADAAALHWRWSLPTESLRMPSGSLEFLIDAHGEVVELGEGTFALVLLARLVPGRQNVAVKAFELEFGVDDAMVWQEIAIMRRCQHPRIVPLLGVAIEGSLLLVAMEWMRGGSLLQALQPPGDKRLRWAERGCQVALDVAEALDFLHTQLGILHSDLKPANVLLSADGRASISDLGVAQVAGSSARTAVGYNRAYAAPEQLVGVRCTLAADIYSFGVLLVALLTQLPVVQRGGWRLPSAPQECPQEAVDLIEECVSTDPQQRPLAAAVLARLRSCAGE